MFQRKLTAVIFIGAALTLAPIVSALAQDPDAAGKPLTGKQVEDLVAAGVSNGRIVKAVEKRGIDFEPTETYLSGLRERGASRKLIRTLRASVRTPLTKDDLLRSVAEGDGERELEKAVLLRGVNFSPTDDDLDTLRIAGARQSLLEAVRGAHQALPAPPNPEPPKAAAQKSESAAAPSTAPPAAAPPVVAESKAEVPAAPGANAAPEPQPPVEATEATAPKQDQAETRPITPVPSPVPVTGPSGWLDILTNLSGAEIWIDGRFYGTSPVRTQLRAGEHSYIIKRGDTARFEKGFALADGMIKTIKVTFVERLGESSGMVEVHTSPEGAMVEVDGAATGGPTPTSFELPTGSHQLVVRLAGRRELRKEIYVQEGQTLTIEETLASEKAARQAP